MSNQLYSLTAAAIQGLKGRNWGAKIPVEFSMNEDGSITPVEGGKTMDTGVQEVINELVNRLASATPATTIPTPATSSSTTTTGGGGPPTTGFTGTLDVLLNGTTIVMNGCTVTVNATHKQLTVQNGLIVAVV